MCIVGMSAALSRTPRPWTYEKLAKPFSTWAGHKVARLSLGPGYECLWAVDQWVQWPATEASSFSRMFTVWGSDCYQKTPSVDHLTTPSMLSWIASAVHSPRTQISCLWVCAAFTVSSWLSQYLCICPFFIPSSFLVRVLVPAWWWLW